MIRSFGATLLAAGIVASGIAPGASAAARPPTASPIAFFTATPAGNRAATSGEVRHLLRLAPLPASARLTDRAPLPLRRGPLSGSPVGPSLVARHRFYRSPMPFRRASHWIAHHAAAGLAADGSGSYGSSGRVLARDVTYTGRASAAWTEPQLDIGVERGPHGGSVWRVDASALWLDPRPLRDTYTGLRARVTGLAGCPASDRRRRDVRNAGARLDHQMLPPGRVTRVLLCAYHGFNGTPFTLTAHRGYGPKVAARLATRLRSMPLSHADGLIVHCPMDDGAADIVDFGFAGHRDVDIWVHASGCRADDNGHITGGDALGGAVARLLR